AAAQIATQRFREDLQALRMLGALIADLARRIHVVNLDDCQTGRGRLGLARMCQREKAHAHKSDPAKTKPLAHGAFPPCATDAARMYRAAWVRLKFRSRRDEPGRLRMRFKASKSAPSHRHVASSISIAHRPTPIRSDCRKSRPNSINIGICCASAAPWKN